MKKLFRIPLLALFTECASTQVRYVGQSLPETSDIEIFFKASDLARPDKEIGQVTAIAPDVPRVTSDAMQAKLVAEARKRGGDAILFNKVGRQQIRSGHPRGGSYQELEPRAKMLKYTKSLG